MRLKSLYLLPFLILAACCGNKAAAQGIHFSQFYNAPMLLNPANAALMPDYDYRLGVNGRNQWGSLVPYTTFTMYGDFQAFRNRNETNWLGVGFSFYNDNAGDGKLNLFRAEAIVAYHVQIGESSMISFGGSASSNQRSVNFSKLTYPVQWDGFSFDPSLPNRENKGLEKSGYASVTAGLNYAIFPSEYFYLKIGGSVANLNKPRESFYEGSNNELDYRPSGSLEIMFQSTESLIISPSAYYSTQSGAYELVYGSLLTFNMAKPDDQLAANQLIFGAYNRWNDAVIGVAGIQLNGWRAMASYDFNISKLGSSANGAGAFELTFRYEGLYSENSKGRRTYHCPRF
jgi:type IX secretion system PorP/SprF family membrane protein